MLWLLTILLAGLALLAAEWLRCSPFYWCAQDIHWIVPWPILGNTARALTQPFANFWLDFYTSAKEHKLVGFHMFGQPAIFVKDPAYITQVMVTDAESYTARGLFAGHKDPFSRSIFVTGGEEWKSARSKMTPYFSPARIKGSLQIVESTVDTFIKELDLKRKRGPVDVDIESMKLSTDVVVSSAFGIQPDSFTDENSFFFGLQRELTGFMFGLRMLVGLISPWLYNLLRLSTFSAPTQIKLSSFITQVLEARTRGVGVRGDFMQGMVELYQQDLEQTDKPKYNHDGTRVAKFDKLGVTAQCMMLFLAGTDTTGHALTFLLYELAVNQDVQDKLREEIEKTMLESDGTPGYEQLSRMVYLNMVYSESLRKYPAAPVMVRKCTRSTRLGDTKVAKGTMLAIPILGIQRDPQHYPEPYKFDPERFAPGMSSHRTPGVYLPFGIGPRTCIGMKLAEMEMKLSACRVVSRFRLTVCPETPSTPSFSLGPILAPLNGMKLNIEPLS